MAGSTAVVEARLSAKNPPASRVHGGVAPMGTLEAALPASMAEELRDLEKRLLSIGWSITTSTEKERDWSVAWRAGLRPVRIACPGGRGRGLLVRASWSGARPRKGEAEVIIDPSMAFGTGTHPTTRMCLRAILWILGGSGGPMTEGPMLDVGTGTGILMIGALKLGVSSALGLDIDEAALKVARKNLRANNVRARLSALPLSRQRGRFALITANIFSEELKRLAPEIVARLGPAPSFVVLSGILREQAPGVVEVYRGLGLRVEKRFFSGEWACVVLGRGAARG
jgi:ribosomal protein L11 methyltransferase